MSLTSYRAAPPRGGGLGWWAEVRRGWMGRPGGDLLSRALRHSTMGAGEFHGRVRDGIGCRLPAIATRSSNPPWDSFGCQWSVFRLPDAIVPEPVRHAVLTRDRCRCSVARKRATGVGVLVRVCV